MHKQFSNNENMYESHIICGAYFMYFDQNGRMCHSIDCIFQMFSLEVSKRINKKRG